MQDELKAVFNNLDFPFVSRLHQIKAEEIAAVLLSEFGLSITNLNMVVCEYSDKHGTLNYRNWPTDKKSVVNTYIELCLKNGSLSN